MTPRRVALAALALLTAFCGYDLYAATSGFVTAYDTYNRIEMKLARFDFTDPSAPIAIGMEIGNPTGQTVEIKTIEIYIRAGVHPVGGGSINPEETFVPGQRETFAIDGNINDTDYVSRLAGQAITWGVSGRILVRLHAGLAPEWITFAGSYATEATPA